MKHCRFCGHEISDDAQFCRACGKNLSESENLASESAPNPKHAASSSAPKAPKKKGKGLLIVIALAMIALGGYALLALWPGLHTNTPPAESTTPNASSSSVNSPADNASSSTSPTDSQPTPQAPAFSTDSRPNWEEFDWSNGLVHLDATPSFGTPIKDFDAIAGGWKCEFLYDTAGEPGQPSRELLNLFIAGAKGNFSVVLDFYQMVYGNEAEDETALDDVALNGIWDDSAGTLDGTGDLGTISFSAFYSYQDQQFALGRLETASGYGATVLMVRP